MANAEKGAAFLDAAKESRPRLVNPKAYDEKVRELYKNGLPGGDKTGWLGLDKFYSVVPGQLTIVTGWPSSGKSEWVDALLVNLSRQGWKFAVFSFENQPVELHITKMLEKLSGKPFRDGPTARMTAEEITEYSDELNESFVLVECGEGSLTAKDLLEEARPHMERWAECKRGLVIDPWNELESWRPSGISETEHISQSLSLVRNWARKNKVHVWIVAHPFKMRKEDGKLPIPKPDMISGSQNWWNKADCNITVYRDLEKIDANDVDIYVQKVRFKHVGRLGQVTLKWDRITGRYIEPLRVAKSYAERGE